MGIYVSLLSSTLSALCIGSELQLGECVASLVPETGPSTCNDSSQSRSGVVTENQTEQRDERSSIGDGKEAESCGEVVESVGEKEQELNEPPQVLCVHYHPDLCNCHSLVLSKH